MPKPTDHMIETAKRFVADMDAKNTNIYVSLAKGVLWLVSMVLVSIVVMLIYRCAWYCGYSTAVLTNIIEACQVLAVIAVTVMGWHGYKGSRIFHLLRHWNDGGGQ